MARAIALWEEAVKLDEKIGAVNGKASTLIDIAYATADQGDVVRAMALLEESLELFEQTAHLHGKAAALSSMAMLVDRQGDMAQAVALWEQSLKLDERVGDVHGQATTLSNMAWALAKQGDVARAMALWNESIRLLEDVGDVKGKAATLANMASASGREGEAKRERELNLEAGRGLATVRAWLDLVIVLGNLGESEAPDALAFLAQALWLCMYVEASVEYVSCRISTFVDKVGPGADIAPLVAAYALFLMETRGGDHPKREELTRLALGMLAACANARNVPPEGFREWLHAERLDEPAALVPTLRRALEGLVGEHEWLFDRTLLRPEN